MISLGVPVRMCVVTQIAMVFFGKLNNTSFQGNSVDSV